MWTRTIVTSRTRHRVALGGILIWMLAASASAGLNIAWSATVPVYPSMVMETS